MRLLLAWFLPGFWNGELLAIVRPDLLTFSGELPPDRLLCGDLGSVTGFHGFPVLLEFLREFRQFDPARRFQGRRSFIAALRLTFAQSLLLRLLLPLKLLPAGGRTDHQLEQIGKAAPLSRRESASSAASGFGSAVLGPRLAGLSASKAPAAR